jgi:hypothetical protein
MAKKTQVLKMPTHTVDLIKDEGFRSFKVYRIWTDIGADGYPHKHKKLLKEVASMGDALIVIYHDLPVR